MFRLAFTILLLGFLPYMSIAQVTAISASKVNSFNAGVIGHGVLELEPTLMTSRSSSYWDENGNKINLDSTTVSSSIQWRMCYGLSDKTEIAFATNPNVDGLNFDMKTYLFNQGKFEMAGMTGLYMPLGNRTFDPKRPSVDDLSSYVMGVIGSFEINDRSSVDANVSYLDYWNNDEAEVGSNIITTLDYGIYNKKRNLYFILSTYYQKSNAELGSNDFFMLSPGISVEVAKNYLIVLNSNHTLFGKNNAISNGISCAFTIAFE